MNEETFLRNRMLREEKKQKREGPSEDTVARNSFVTQLETLHRQIDDILSLSTSTAGNGNTNGGVAGQEGGGAGGGVEGDPLDKAHERWLEMQASIRTAADILKLPPHELRTANGLLSHLFAKISSCRVDSRGGDGRRRKFKFSSRVKLYSKTDILEREQKGQQQAGATGGDGVSKDAEESIFGQCIVRDRTNETVYVSKKGAVFLRRCRNCTLFLLPTEGSVFVDDCTDCVIYTAPHQLRMKSCHNVKVFVACRSTPIIEACREMKFGSYIAWEGLLNTDIPKDLAQGSPANHSSPLSSSAANKKDSTERAAVESSPQADTEGNGNGSRHMGRLSTHEEWLQRVGNIWNWDAHAKDSYQHVDDFDWIKLQHSPYWAVLTPEEWTREQRPFDFAVAAELAGFSA